MRTLTAHTLAIFGLLLLPAATLAQDVKANLNEAAIHISTKVANQLKTRLPAAGKHRIAVLAFGDENRKHPKQMGDLGIQLRGQSIEALKDTLTNTDVAGESLGTKFSVLSFEQIEAVFASTSNDTGGLTDQNVDLARTVLNAENIDIGIVGHFKFDGATISSDNIEPNVTVEVTAIFPSDSETSTFQIKASEILLHILKGTKPDTTDDDGPGGTPPKLASRFKVQVLAQPVGSSTFEEIPLQTVTDPSEPLFNTLVLLIDEARFKGRRYKLRITNQADEPIAFLDGGLPGQQNETVIRNLSDAKEKDRVLLLSSYVDGVSTIKRRVVQSGGVVSFDKDVRNYPLVRKYIITGPGRRFQKDDGADTDRFRDAKLVNTSGADPGHSLLDVQGFLKVQPDGAQSTSGVFIFGDSTDSIGQEFVGTGVSQIGIISLYFFAEKFSDDVREQRAIQRPVGVGTLEGDDIPTPTITVGVKNVYPIPVETWHIVYKYKGAGDPPTTPITQ